MLLRIFRGVVLSIGALVALSLWLPPAHAEGFFSKLFNWGGSRQNDRRIDPPTFNFGFRGQGFEYGRSINDNSWPQDTARYRSLCVRTCDGFYFPIGDNVGRERLYQDARTCAARCDGEAALYYPVNGGSPETMVDMAGRAYSQTQTAFLYRKTLVQGCTCKSAPWSAETAARHQGYKDDAQALADMRDSERRYAGQASAGGDGDIGAYLMREGDGPQQTPWNGGRGRN